MSRNRRIGTPNAMLLSPFVINSLFFTFYSFPQSLHNHIHPCLQLQYIAPCMHLLHPLHLDLCTQDQHQAHGARFSVLQVKTHSPLTFSNPASYYLNYGRPSMPYIPSMHTHLGLCNIDRNQARVARFSPSQVKSTHPHRSLDPWLHHFPQCTHSTPHTSYTPTAPLFLLRANTEHEALGIHFWG
jgi:hypothetical protein